MSIPLIAFGIKFEMHKCDENQIISQKKVEHE